MDYFVYGLPRFLTLQPQSFSCLQAHRDLKFQTLGNGRTVPHWRHIMKVIDASRRQFLAHERFVVKPNQPVSSVAV